MFGYVEGAFTGARKGGKAGVFEMAHGGTLLLDEVGEIPPVLQSRFLRVIEQREIMRLGDSRILPINVRLIAATHRDLRDLVKRNLFREDLYYRLNVLSLSVPDLKDREGDVLEIADKFLREFYDMQGKSYGVFSPESAQLLLAHKWPGNIRQLRNVMERLSVMTAGGLIDVRDVRRALQIQETPQANDQDGASVEDLIIATGDGPDKIIEPDNQPHKFQYLVGKEKALYEKQLIMKTLEECNGSRTRTARKLGISRTTLWRKLQQGADN